MVTLINNGIIFLQLLFILLFVVSLLATILRISFPCPLLNNNSISEQFSVLEYSIKCPLYINNHLIVAVVTCQIYLTFQEMHH